MNSDALTAISTKLSRDDLVLHHETEEQIEKIVNHWKYDSAIIKRSGLHKKGYRVLFYGPPGTGKKLAAALIGKEINKPVYKIDLSLLVSKYIGEMEKNLEKVFTEAEKKEWILFFDEADALFGKRTDVKDSHDRYANIEMNWLLQRIEDHNGLVILATNMKNNIDDAFIRRFQSIVKFNRPSAELRRIIWMKAFASNNNISSDIDILSIAKKYELSGKEIQQAMEICRATVSSGEKITGMNIIKAVEAVYKSGGRTIH